MFVRSLSACTCAVRATDGDSYQALQTNPFAKSAAKELHEGHEVCGKAEEVTIWRCRRRCGAKLIPATAALPKPIWYCLRHPSNARHRRHRSSRKGYGTSPESLETIVYVYYAWAPMWCIQIVNQNRKLHKFIIYDTRIAKRLLSDA